MITRDREVRQIVGGVLLCFMLSGMTGLIYEVLWVRMLGLIFGHTVFAVTTVLAAFMGGLSIGSFLLGGLADRQRRPLVLYGLLEIGVGLSCLGMYWLLPWVTKAYLALGRAFSLSFHAFSVVQFLLILALLLVPTTLMGATLPVLARFFARDARTLGQRVGLLYALNTFGAVLGAAFAGYVLLPTFGKLGTLLLTATVTIGIGALAVTFGFHYDRLRRSDEEFQRAPQMPMDPLAAPARPATLPIMVGLAVSGAASMIYEVAWTRALALAIGSSTFAFTAMLVAFLTGLAAGSALYSKVLGSRPTTATTFGLVQLAIGAAATLVFPLFGMLPDLVLRGLAVSVAPGWVQTFQVLVSILAMLVPTMLMGATFPCAVKLVAARLERVAGDVGRLYAANTLGAIVGTILAGFALIPAFGAHATVKAAIVLNLATGLAVVAARRSGLPRRQWGAIAALALLTAGGLLLAPGWNPAVMTAGAAVYGPGFKHVAGKFHLAEMLSGREPVFYEDGVSATVSIHRNGPSVFLRVNGKTDASNGGDMHTQLMSAHIPLLLHPHPKDVLVIGLASGVTAGAVAQHPVDHIDVVEIEPAMVRASAFFANENRNVLKDARVHLAIADGRNFLLNASRRYDVIISEPSNPWIRGLATLFTQEYFELAASRLTPEGIMLQWVQGYGLNLADFKMVVRTFQTAFEATSVWQTHGGDYLLVGRRRVSRLDLDRIRYAWQTMPALRQDMTMLGMASPYALLADFTLNESDATRFAGDADIQTDDLLQLEFSAPQALYADTASLNFRAIRSFKNSEFPLIAGIHPELDSVGVRYDLGAAHMRKQSLPDAALQFEVALRADPAHVPSLLELGKARARMNLPLKATEAFQTVLRLAPKNAEAHYQLSLIYQSQLMPVKAMEFAARAAALGPEEPPYRVHAGNLLLAENRLSEAIPHYLAALERRGDDVGALVGLASTYIRQGRPTDAVHLLEGPLAKQPDQLLLLRHAGKAYLAAKRYPEATRTLQAALRLDPLTAEGHTDLGYALTGLGDLTGAMASFERALSLDPTQTAATQALGQLYAKIYGNR